MNKKNIKQNKKIPNNNVLDKKIININQKKQIDLYDNNMEYDNISKNFQNNIPAKESNFMSKETYIEQLESKIEQQGKKISELNKYKYLCEKRLKQLNPNEILPLTIESLNDENNNNNNIINNKNILDLDKKDIHQKYILLNDKFQKLLNDYNDIIKNNNNNIQDTSTNTINMGNINEKYKILKEKYKKIKEENNRIIELLKEETKACEMQKNIIDLLKQAIDNDISKNNEIKKYITVDNIIDFTQLKLESEQYRKELVLSQALVNSLKSEIEQLNKEKEEIKNNYNNLKYDNNYNDLEYNNNYNNLEYNNNYKNNNYKNNNYNDEDKDNDNKKKEKMDEMDINKKENNNNYYENNDRNNQEENKEIMNENISLKNTLNSQAQIIKELMDENKNLKKLVDEATIKLNDAISNRNENKINNDNLNYQLNYQLNSKINEVKQYEDKFIYFNDYISTVKSIFINFQENLPKFINIYNKMANEDLNSLLSSTFSQSIIQLHNRINQINKIEKFNLETNIETEITNIIIEFLQIINNEFISIYEKVFQTNSYYIESTKKIEELQLQIRDNEKTNQNNLKKINDINDLLNNEKRNIDEYKNNAEDYKIKLAICQLEKENINKKIETYIDDRHSIINCFYSMINALSLYNDNLAQLLRDSVNIIETKAKLFNEKEIIMEQLTKNRIKDLNRNKLYQNNPEVNKIVTQEQITLQNLINEFENKIKEKEEQLFDNKEKIKQSLLDLQKNTLIQNNNINNNEINNIYNYFIKQNNNNDNYSRPEINNYNIDNKKVNNINNNKKNQNVKTTNKNQGKNTRTTNMHSSEQKNNINDKF